MIDEKDLKNRFTYHAPDIAQQQKYEGIRKNASWLSTLLNTHCPDGREKSLAITKLEECVMWANASIARNK